MTALINISTLDESDPEVYETIYYKVPVVNGNMDETVIVTCSPKYRAYQKQIREQQISRTLKMIGQPGRRRKGKNQNDPARFIKTTSVTNDGKIAEKKVCELDVDRIRDEEKYDGINFSEPVFLNCAGFRAVSRSSFRIFFKDWVIT